MAKKAAPVSASDIRIEYTKLSDVLRWPRNPKKHAEKDLDDSIRRFGFADPPAVDEGTGRLVEGHGRVESLARLKKSKKPPPKNVRVGDDGDWLVPVVRGNTFASEAEAEAYLLAHNRIAEVGGWDRDLLAPVLSDVRDGDLGLDGVGWTDSQVDRLLDDGEAETEPDDALPATRYQIVVTCADAEEQASLLQTLESEGLTCEAQTS